MGPGGGAVGGIAVDGLLVALGNGREVGLAVDIGGGGMVGGTVGKGTVVEVGGGIGVKVGRGVRVGVTVGPCAINSSVVRHASTPTKNKAPSATRVPQFLNCIQIHTP